MKLNKAIILIGALTLTSSLLSGCSDKENSELETLNTELDTLKDKYQLELLKDDNKNLEDNAEEENSKEENSKEENSTEENSKEENTENEGSKGEISDTENNEEKNIKFELISEDEGKGYFSRLFSIKSGTNDTAGYEYSGNIIYVTLGTKTTGGYSIDVENIKDKSGTITLNIKSIEPGENAVTMALEKVEQYIKLDITKESFSEKDIVVILDGEEMKHISLND